MRKFAFALVVSVVFGMAAVSASAQACPTLKLSLPDGGKSAGQKELLMATVENGPATVKPEFKWTSNGGKGEMGTTPGIAWLDTTGVPVGTKILVTVEAVGYGCTLKAEGTITMVERGPCPKLSVYSDDTVSPGQTLTMDALIQLGDPNVTPTFRWMISAGKIVSGQGTSSINIDTTGASGTITGTVEIGGYQSQCDSTASSTTSLVSKPQTRKFDEFSPMMKDEVINERLDNFAIELQNDKTAKGVLLFYAGRTSRVGAIEALLAYAKKHLSSKRAIPATQLVAQDGGFRESGLIELWLMPAGAPMPTPSNFLDPSEIKKLPAKKKP